MVYLLLIEHGYGQSKIYLEHVNILSLSDICFSIDKYIKNDADAQLSQYIASGQKEIPGLFEKSHLVK